MTHYEDKCVICKDLVHSYDYPNDDYELRSYNHQTHKPYESRGINIPEQEYTIYLDICLACQSNLSALSDLIKKKRLKWYDDKIISEKNSIKRKLKQIENLKNELPEIKKNIKKLQGDKKKVK